MKPTEIEGIAYLTYAGSIAYGTNTETSDVDIRGFYQESIEDIITGKSKETISDSVSDTVVFSLRKFIRLCKNANPNVLELLGTKDEHIIFMNEVGKLIRDNKELFITKKVYESFGGFAYSEMQKLRTGRAINWHKSAMHAARLCLMGIDLLEGRGLIVYREKDLKLLMKIRRGELCRGEILERLRKLDKKLAVVASESKLPAKPDESATDNLLIKAYELSRKVKG